MLHPGIKGPVPLSLPRKEIVKFRQVLNVSRSGYYVYISTPKALKASVEENCCLRRRCGFTPLRDTEEWKLYSLNSGISRKVSFIYMTPVAGGIAAAKYYWLIFGLCLSQGFFSPRIPVNRIMCMLQEVRRLFIYQAVGAFMVISSHTALPRRSITRPSFT